MQVVFCSIGNIYNPAIATGIYLMQLSIVCTCILDLYLQPEGHILLDRFNSLMKRNILEVRGRPIPK
jgi:hypothetical protein